MLVLFFHGLESGPNGQKTQDLQDAGYSVVSPDMRNMDLHARVLAAKVCLETYPDSQVVGSSFGGLTALLAQNSGVASHSMVLCAPALRMGDVSQIEVKCPTIIIHGIQDDVCPIEDSRDFAAKHSNVTLIEVDDNHRLKNSHSVILDALKALANS